MSELKEEQVFIATIRKGPRSLTLGGQEGAGKKLGPFVAKRITTIGVDTGSRFFSYADFFIDKVEK